MPIKLDAENWPRLTMRSDRNRKTPHVTARRIALNNEGAKRGPQWTGIGEFQRLDTQGSINLQPLGQDR
jgi:hypothetical protein